MKKTKVLSILLSVIMAFGVFGTAFSASAAYVSVHLLTNQNTNSSSNVYGTHKYYWGNNNANSDDNVEFVTRYKKGGVWYTDDKYVMIPGDSLNESQARRTANRFTDERYWFLKLNKASSGTGCDAWGYIKNA